MFFNIEIFCKQFHHLLRRGCFYSGRYPPSGFSKLSIKRACEYDVDVVSLKVYTVNILGRRDYEKKRKKL